MNAEEFVKTVQSCGYGTKKWSKEVCRAESERRIWNR